MAELTEQQKADRAAALAKGRATAAANRAAQKTAPADEPAVAMAPLVHEGEASAPVIAEPDDPAAEDVAEGEAEPDEFERFLAAQDAETREILTDVELRVIYEAETKRAADERKTATKKAVAARALRHARLGAGLLSPEAIAAAGLRDRLQRKVTWTVNMPEAGKSGELITEGPRIDGRLLYHGQEVTGTLAEYESYREIEWRCHQAELDFQGVGRLSRWRRGRTPDANMVQMA